MKTFHISSPSFCPRRGLDAEKVRNYFLLNRLVSADDPGKADIIFINTCGAFKKAEQISLEAVRYLAGRKNAKARLVIGGCLPDINPAALPKDIAPFDLIPPKELHKLDGIIDGSLKFNDAPEPNRIRVFDFPCKSMRVKKAAARLRLGCRNFLTDAAADFLNRKFTGRWKNRPLLEEYPLREVYAVRIAEGCLGSCSFCAIKFGIGKQKSKPIELVVEEFKRGLSENFKLFSLVADDAGSYGVDTETSIVELLGRIFQIAGDYKVIITDLNCQWLVRHYPGLEAILLKHCDKVAYITLPVQSASNRVLKLMNRPYRIEEVRHCLGQLKTKIPGLRITTHALVGFPQESEADFKQTVDFIREFKFSFVDIYAYHDAHRTLFSAMAGKIPRAVINRRVGCLKRAQEEILRANEHPARKPDIFLKRSIDLLFAAWLLFFSLPLFVMITALIKFTSPGPVLFKQKRRGLQGFPFMMYKFRSMVNNAEQARSELEAFNVMRGPVFKMRQDPRVTRIGRFLRKSSLDELPQLWNVLKGEMSLVGPRPLIFSEADERDPRQLSRLKVKPGLTCLWQVSGRSNIIDFEKWLKLDLEYIAANSILLDIKILLKTIPVVISGFGAE